MIDVMKLKREREALVKEMRAIVAEAEKRDTKRMTDAEGERWGVCDAEVKRYDAEIQRAERMNQLEMENAQGNEGREQEQSGEKRFASHGEFLQAVRAASIGGKVDPRLIPEERAGTGMNETTPSDGGFAVQTDQQAGILKRAYELSQLAARCRKIGVGANANALSWLAVDESSRATGSRWGGVRGYWAAEASTVTASQFKLRKARMELEKLMAFMYFTEEMLQDSTGMESLADQAVAEEFAWLMDEAVMNGLGAGTPLGWMNSDALVSVAKESGQAAATIVYENCLKMWARMWSRSRQNAIWVINQDCEPQLYTMALVIGAGGVPVYMPASSTAPGGLLFGRPVVAIEQAKTCGTTGDINLVDLSQYLLTDKGGTNKAASMHVRFLYDEQVFRYTYRVNGQPVWNAPLTPANGASNTVSPFVSLATRA